VVRQGKIHDQPRRNSENRKSCWTPTEIGTGGQGGKKKKRLKAKVGNQRNTDKCVNDTENTHVKRKKGRRTNKAGGNALVELLAKLARKGACKRNGGGGRVLPSRREGKESGGVRAIRKPGVRARVCTTANKVSTRKKWVFVNRNPRLISREQRLG